MKAILDFFQSIFDINDQWIRLAGCFLLAFLIISFFRTIKAVTRRVLGLVRECLPKASLDGLLLLVGLTTILLAFSVQFSDLCQDIEQMAIDPDFLGQASMVDDGEMKQLYENKIFKKFRQDEGWKFTVLKKRTEEMAEKLGTTPLAIYETADLECGCDPFNIRADGVAAGWIQFTRVGCKGLGVALDQVIAECKARNINFVMDLTEKYLIRKKNGMTEGATLANGIDLYLAVFAPAHIGRGPQVVVYKGYDNPEYFKNAGLDGWYLSGDRICRSRSMMNGEICIGEIFLSLQSRKAKLAKSLHN